MCIYWCSGSLSPFIILYLHKTYVFSCCLREISITRTFTSNAHIPVRDMTSVNDFSSRIIREQYTWSLSIAVEHRLLRFVVMTVGNISRNVCTLHRSK